MSKEILNVDGVPTLKINNQEDVSGYELIDVRRAEEYSGELGHIEGAQLKTLGPELESYLSTADKSKNILFICRSGARSANATLIAMQLGFNNVFNMQGGMMAWNENGFDVSF